MPFRLLSPHIMRILNLRKRQRVQPRQLTNSQTCSVGKSIQLHAASYNPNPHFLMPLMYFKKRASLFQTVTCMTKYLVSTLLYDLGNGYFLNVCQKRRGGLRFGAETMPAPYGRTHAIQSRRLRQKRTVRYTPEGYHAQETHRTCSHGQLTHKGKETEHALYYSISEHN